MNTKRAKRKYTKRIKTESLDAITEPKPWTPNERIEELEEDLVRLRDEYSNVVDKNSVLRNCLTVVQELIALALRGVR